MQNTTFKRLQEAGITKTQSCVSSITSSLISDLLHVQYQTFSVSSSAIVRPGFSELSSLFIPVTKYSIYTQSAR